MYKAFKYRIYPTKEQASLMDKTINACRIIYNLALETKIYAYKSHGVKLTKYDLINQLPELKTANPWLKEVDSQSLHSAILIMDKSFKSFFNGSGFPKFKKKKDYGSFQCPNRPMSINFSESTLTIAKNKNIPIRLSREFIGDIKRITITKTPTNKYFASILVLNDIEEPLVPDSKNAVGIDLGLFTFASLSTGEKIETQGFLKKELSRLKTLQRRNSRAQKGSKNKNKAKINLARLHERIANQRNDFLHKLSTKLIRDNQTDTICVETLSVKNMIKNHNLAKAISDASWSEFIRQLEYKGKWYGKNIIKVGRFFASSKTCSNCNHKLDELPLSVREWTCPKCGANHDRDINAAINIKYSGMGSPGGPVELPAIVGAKKQEVLIINTLPTTEPVTKKALPGKSVVDFSKKLIPTQANLFT